MLKTISPTFAAAIKNNLILPRYSNSATTPDSVSAIVPLPIAYPIMNSSMQIEKVHIVHGGGKYSVAPTATVLPTSNGNGGATLTCELDSGGYVKHINITNPGTANTYVTVPTIGFSGGTTPSPFLREDPQYALNVNVGGYRILWLRPGAKKLIFSTTNVAAVNMRITIGFFNERIWTPPGTATGARGLGSDGFTKYACAVQGGIPIISNVLPYGHKVIPIPQGLFSDQNNTPVDAFCGILYEGAVQLTVQEVF